MNKKVFNFFILIALFLSGFYYTNVIQKPIIYTLNNVKIGYHNTVEFVQNGFIKYFFQASQISLLQNKLLRYENNHLVMQQLATEITDLYKENNSSLKIDPRAQLVRTISYQKFGDLNRIWIEVDDYNDSRIYGLTYKELVAGIVIPKNEKPLALLNRDLQSSYAVFVGSNDAPGIAHGTNGENIIIKFIPAWFSIATGDEVTTSGLDDLFFKGLKVGKVLSVTKAQGYQNAMVKPYFETNDPNYFHMIRRLK